MYIADVLIEHPVNPLDRPFSYLCELPISKGIRVKVPFAAQSLVGYVESVLETTLSEKELEEENGYPLKWISEIIDEKPLLNSELMQVADYLSKITLSPKISCLSVMLPIQFKPSSKNGVGKKYERYVQAVDRDDLKMTPKQKACHDYLKELRRPMRLKEVPYSAAILKKLAEIKAIDILDVEVYRNHYLDIKTKEVWPQLTSPQQKAVEGITNELKHKVCLLYGVTGSGKTEVYLQAAKKVLSQQKTVMMLVPEIALTPMMVTRFKERFGPAVAVLHSRLSQGEKYDEYRRILKHDVKIVVGARSAIFAPLENIGLIIMDEEHDQSYKQDSAPRYHTRDIARFRAEYHRCPLVLASATPSIETYARAKKGTYALFELKKRINNQPMPNVTIVDMAKEVSAKNYSLFSRTMRQRLQDCIDQNHQAILLLNRRGYSNYLQCKGCGYVVKCPHCDVTLTYHKDEHVMKCHYCDYTAAPVSTCPNCQGRAMYPVGYGTQKVEEMIQKEFTNAKVIRMDVDTTRKKGAHEQLLKAFEKQEANILLGTQMIAKGLDFANVTFVGVLNADQTLNLPDFRANERTFQLLCQVSGRSGRGEETGSVVIQTYNPDHYAIQSASQHNYLAFYQKEIQYRYYGNYPPYCRMVSLEIRGKDENIVTDRAQQIAVYLKNNATHATVLGPAPSLIYRMNDYYRYRILIKYKNGEGLMDALNTIHQHYNRERKEKVSVMIDFNPYTQI